MNKTILFFDADCLFCNFWVQFLLKQDKKKQFYFAALQSKVAQICLEPKHQYLESLILLHQGEIYQKSKAVFKICALLKGWFYIFLIFTIIPNFILDFFYDLIAKHRHKILKDQCLILKDERILD